MTNEEIRSLIDQVLSDIKGWGDGTVDPEDLSSLDLLFDFLREQARSNLQKELNDPERVMLIKRLTLAATLVLALLDADVF